MVRQLRWSCYERAVHQIFAARLLRIQKIAKNLLFASFLRTALVACIQLHTQACLSSVFAFRSLYSSDTRGQLLAHFTKGVTNLSSKCIRVRNQPIILSSHDDMDMGVSNRLRRRSQWRHRYSTIHTSVVVLKYKELCYGTCRRLTSTSNLRKSCAVG